MTEKHKVLQFCKHLFRKPDLPCKILSVNAGQELHPAIGQVADFLSIKNKTNKPSKTADSFDSKAQTALNSLIRDETQNLNEKHSC